MLSCPYESLIAFFFMLLVCIKCLLFLFLFLTLHLSTLVCISAIIIIIIIIIIVRMAANVKRKIYGNIVYADLTNKNCRFLEWRMYKKQPYVGVHVELISATGPTKIKIAKSFSKKRENIWGHNYGPFLRTRSQYYIFRVVYTSFRKINVLNLSMCIENIRPL